MYNSPQSQPKTCRRAKHLKGFTLIEVIVTTVLVALAGLAAYSTYSSGVSIWLKTAQITATEETYTVMEKLSRDLRNSFAFGLADNKWEEHRIRFPALVNSLITTKNDADKPQYEQITQLGWVEYSFSSEEGILYRMQGVFGENPETKKGKAVIKNIRGASFSFVFPEKQNDKSLPVSVKVEINASPAGPEAKNDNIIARTIYIPVSKQVQTDEKEK